MELFTPETNNNNSKGVSYMSGFWLTIGLALLGFVFSGVLLALLIKGNVAALKDPRNSDMIRIIQTVSVIFSMLLPAIIAAGFLNRKPIALLGYHSEVSFQQVGLVLLITFMAIVVAGSLGYLNRIIPISPGLEARFQKMEASYAEQVGILLDFKSAGGYILSIFIMAFLPALCEETLFRGALQNFFTRATKRPWLSIILISILFSLVHSSFYGFLPRMFLGIVLGLVFHISRNIWLCILVHFFNNALAVSSVYFLMKQGKTMKEAVSDDMSPSLWGLLALPILYLLFRSLQKNSSLQIETKQHS